MEVHYDHQWQVQLPLHSVWKFFMDCLKDSRSISEWPHSVSDLRAIQNHLSKGTEILATYRLGPFERVAQYVLTQVEQDREIQYSTAKGHPLIGHSQIKFIPNGSTTVCHWSGYYRSQDLKGLAPLFSFKLFFEKIFFNQLKKNMHSLEIKKAQAA